MAKVHLTFQYFFDCKPRFPSQGRTQTATMRCFTFVATYGRHALVVTKNVLSEELRSNSMSSLVRFFGLRGTGNALAKTGSQQNPVVNKTPHMHDPIGIHALELAIHMSWCPSHRGTCDGDALPHVGRHLWATRFGCHDQHAERRVALNTNESAWQDRHLDPLVFPTLFELTIELCMFIGLRGTGNCNDKPGGQQKPGSQQNANCA